jgi:hypothetical protein
VERGANGLIFTTSDDVKSTVLGGEKYSAERNNIFINAAIKFVRT